MTTRVPRRLTEAAIKSLAALDERPDDNLTPAPLRLKKWMLANQITASQLGMMTCINRKHIDYYLRGGHRSKSGYIQLHQAFAIEWATKGEVPAWLWLDMPASQRRIRSSRQSGLADFERGLKHHILKWSSLKTNDGMIREKARTLSRLFNVQWGEVKKRAWADAENKASLERANIDHLLRPEEKGPTRDGIYVTTNEEEGDEQLTDDEWFAKHTKG